MNAVSVVWPTALLVLGVGCAHLEETPRAVEIPDLVIELPEPDIEFRPPKSETWHPATPGQPGLWRATGDDGSFTLLGSIHVGDERTADLGAAVDLAWGRSDEVVLEIDLSKVDAARTRELFEEYGMLEPPATLQSVISPETWVLLEASLEEAGQAPETVQQLKPWLAALALAGGAFTANRLDAELGVDRRLHDRARGHGPDEGDVLKPVVGLETVESQVRTFAAMPLSVQESMLHDTLAPTSAIGPSSLVEAWRRGDVDAFAELLEPDDPQLQILFEHLVFRRNRQMVARLDDMAADGKERFVVVGLLHLVGPRGIPALLSGRGYRVQRLE